MRSRDFCYWLQGFFEVADDRNNPLTVSQVETIKKHLSLVFKHEIDPEMGDAKHQSHLNQIHQGKEPLIRC